MDTTASVDREGFPYAVSSSINISPQPDLEASGSSSTNDTRGHARLESTDSSASHLSYDSSTPSLCSGSPTSLSSFASPPMTPRSPLPLSIDTTPSTSKRIHRYTSHEHLSSIPFTSSSSRLSPSTTLGRRNAHAADTTGSEDKFTQLPAMSPRERRSSSATLAAQSLRRHRSRASLGAPVSAVPYGTDGFLPSTPQRLHQHDMLSIPNEGRRLSKKHIEASRRSAKEALEEDLRALDLTGAQQAAPNDDFVLDCYFTSLDYLLKALKNDADDKPDAQTRRAMRVRLLGLADSLATPEELALEQAKQHQRVEQALRESRASSSKNECTCGASAHSASISAFFASLLAALWRDPIFTAIVSILAAALLEILRIFELCISGASTCYDMACRGAVAGESQSARREHADREPAVVASAGHAGIVEEPEGLVQ